MPFCLGQTLGWETAAQLVELNAMGLIGLPSSRGQLVALNHQRPGDLSHFNGWRPTQSSVRVAQPIIGSAGKVISMAK